MARYSGETRRLRGNDGGVMVEYTGETGGGRHWAGVTLLRQFYIRTNTITSRLPESELVIPGRL